jgi:hypothetical protein
MKHQLLDKLLGFSDVSRVAHLMAVMSLAREVSFGACGGKRFD